MDEQNEQLSQDGLRQLTQAGGRAGKLAARLLKLLAKLLGKWLVAALAILAVGMSLYAIADYFLEERGSSGSLSLDPEYENPSYTDTDGVTKAVAMTEPQARIDAYYKYMSAASYVKYYGNKTFALINSDDSGGETSDFAGLVDYLQRENSFYLSSYFIKMADELFHHEEFFFPEQIIKPVHYSLEGGIVAAKRLIEHQPDSAEPDEITVTSHKYEAGVNPVNQTADEVPGVWDWGFGSVLQYEPKQKDVYIRCTYNTFEIDVDTISWVQQEAESGEAGDGEGGGEESGPSYVWVTEQSHKGIYTITVTDDDSVDTLKEKIDAYNDTPTSEGGADYDIVAACPSDDVLGKLVDADYNARIPQPVPELSEDYKSATRDFFDPVLAPFSNTGGNKPSSVNAGYDSSRVYYPINVPALLAAACMSGTMRYRYDGIETTEVELAPGVTEYAQWEDDVTDVAVGTGCDDHALIAVRSGYVCTELPKVETEESEAWGFEYIDDYARLYVAYVPQGVQEDLDFSKRTEEEGTKEHIVELGLMRPFTGGVLDAVADVNQSDLDVMAKLIHAEAGHNMLDRLMVGGVLVNRYYYYEGRYTLLQLVAQGNGAQYACWSNGSFQAAAPTPQDYEAARLVLSGEFALPKNVWFQSQAKLGTTFLYNDNNPALGEGGHYYCYGWRNTVAAPTDSFGRPAKSESEIRALAQELDEQTGGAPYESMNESAAIGGRAGIQFVPSDLPAGRDYYAIEEFDVVTATRNLQRIADNDDTLFSWLGEQAERLFGAVRNALFGNAPIADSPKTRYVGTIPSTDAHNVVIQAMTFSQKDAYSVTASLVEGADDLSTFLFVGKSGYAGLGTSTGLMRLVPSTGSSIDGFISPTSDYYAISEGFSKTHDYTLLAVPEGTNILSVSTGTVSAVHTGEGPGTSGSSVVIDYSRNGDNYTIVFGNLAEVSVHVGDTTAKGQVVGLAGSGGLELKLSVNGQTADAMEYFYRPVWSSGVPFADLLGADGSVDPSKVSAFQEAVKAANNRPNTSVDRFIYDSIAGTYDEWHHPDYFGKRYLWECPWWAWGRAMQYLTAQGQVKNLPLPKLGNGGDYYKNAAIYFQRGQTPRANAWVSWSNASAGHVAYVEAVDPDGRGFWISESGRSYTYPHVKHVRADGTGDYPWNYGAGYQMNGFVYLDQPLS